MPDDETEAFDELAFLLADDEAIGVANSNGAPKFYEASEEVSDPEPELASEVGPIVGDGECKICHAPTFRPPGLTRTGRLKRAPVYCDIHNPKGIRQRGDELSNAELDAQLKKVQVQLADDVMLFSMALGTFFPVTGYYMMTNSDAFTTAALQLGRNNPRIMRVAHRLATIAPVYQIGRYAGGIFTSFQVDQQKHDPHSRVAMHLGVSDAYDAVYSNTNVNSTPSGPVNSMFNGPPKYATVQ